MYIGIDPGLGGAVAVLDHAGALVAVHDTPVLTLRTSRGSRQEYDVPGLVTLLAPYAGSQAHVILEESQAMPGQGTRSMFTVGLGFGVWLGILGTLGLAHTRNPPRRVETPPGAHQGQRTGQIESHAALPWRRSAAEARPRQSRGVVAGVVWVASGILPRGNLMTAPRTRKPHNHATVYRYGKTDW